MDENGEVIENTVEQPIRKTYEPTEPNSNETINIYAGTGENADLSNFAVRPFIATNDGLEPDGPIAGNFKTVEGAFQAQKLAYSSVSDDEKKLSDNN